MAITNNHWPPGNTVAGSRYSNALRTFEQARNALIQEVFTMNAMLEGNGSDPSHYNKMNTTYGFGGLNEAMAARNETLAGVGRVDALGDAGNTVGAQTRAALDQLFTRLRA